MDSHRTTLYRFSKGLTAIELLVGIAILGILAAMASPTMGDLVARYQIRSTAEQLSTLILRAQTEALRRNGFIQLNKSDNGSSVNPCVEDNDWSCGIELKLTTTTTLLAVLQVPRGVQVRNVSSTSISPASKSLGFDRWGRTAQKAEFRLTKNNVPSQRVCVSVSGLVSLPKPDDGCT